MTTLILRNYPEAGTNDALFISAPADSIGLVSVYDSTGADVTDYLVAHNILRWRAFALNHGWVAVVDAALNWRIEKAYIAMSSQFNAGETPVFFARVVNSLTNEPLTTSDVSSISLTIYSYSSNNIRTSSGTPFVPLEDWDDVSLTVNEVLRDNPTVDRRVSFIPNLVFEPNTLTDNPFETPGQYRAQFTITPTVGNRVPVAIDFRVS